LIELILLAASKPVNSARSIEGDTRTVTCSPNPPVKWIYRTTTPAGCSSRLSSKAALNYYSLRSRWDDPNYARPTKTFHLPTRCLEGVARLPFTARIGRAHSDRARSASKKGTWPLPLILLRPRVARARGSSQPLRSRVL